MDQLTEPRDTLADIDPAAARQRVADWLRGATLEISARDQAADAVCRGTLMPGTAVSINHAAGDTTSGLVAAAVRLRQAGLTPIPHVAARLFESYTRLGDFLARAAGEAGVDRILLVAGDADRPVGPYAASLEVLETGLLAKHGIRRIGLAAYPEGHPRLAPAMLAESLATKLTACRRLGLAPMIVTQFCLDADPILGWIAAARGTGVECPIQIGLAGPTSVAALAKFAVRSGIGRSIGSLVQGQTSVARLLVEAGPEPIIQALARAAAGAIAGLHLFSFGGVARTAAWLGAAQRGDFSWPEEGDSFRVRS